MRLSACLLASFLLATVDLQADGLPVAPPGTGRVIATGATVASNGDGFLVRVLDATGSPMAVAIDRAGRRVSDGVPLPAACGSSLLRFGGGYLATCPNQTLLLHLDAQGRTIRTILLTDRSERALATKRDRILIWGTAGLRVIDGGGAQIGRTFPLPPSSFVAAAVATASGFAVISDGAVIRISSDAAMEPVTQVLPRPWPAVSLVSAAVGDDVVVAGSDWRGNVHTVTVSGSGAVTTRENVTFGMYVLDLLNDGDSLLLFGRRPNDHLKPHTGAVARIGRDGTLLRFPEGIASSARFLEAGKVAANGENLLFVTGPWTGPMWTGEFSDIVSITVPIRSLASPPAEEIVSIGPLSQERPSAAPLGTDSLVVWREAASGSSAIRARRLRGGVPFGDPIELATARRPSAPRVAVAGEVVLAAWIAGDSIYGTRIDSHGKALDNPPMRIAAALPELSYGFIDFAIGSDGRNFAVAWIESLRDHQRIGSASVLANGWVGPAQDLVIGSPATGGGMVSQFDARNSLSVVWSVDRYLIAWAHERWSSVISSIGLEWREIRVLSLDRGLAAVLTPETAVDRELARPRVASGGGVLAILAEAGTAWTGRQYALIVDPRSLAVIARYELGTGELRERAGDGAVAWSGHDFVFAWRGGTGSMLTRLMLGANPRTLVLDNSPSEVTLTVAGGRVDYLAVTGGLNFAPSARTVLAYDESDFHAPAGRRRLVRR